MQMSHFFLGVATGVPVMIIVGPIALLLIEQGLRNGIRGGAPAAFGVAAADLAFASASAVTGAAAARLLEPIEPMLRVAAIAVLGVLAWRLWRAARSDLLEIERTSGARSVMDGPLAVSAVGVPGERGTASFAGSVSVDDGLDAGDDESVGAQRRGRLTMAVEFFAVTALNPITVVVFTSIVVGGAAGVGTVGWVVGMVAASLMVNMSFLSIGHGLGAVLDDRATARLRMGGALLIVGLAFYFAFA